MDLYVKIQRLKHNFRKVQGCFCKNYGPPTIYGIYRFIFLKKTPWTESMAWWTESTAPAHGVYGSSLNGGRRSSDERSRSTRANGYFTF
jgi:hypothetical protein